jgi:hypothetical protein
MKLKYSFVNLDGFIEGKALVQLYLLNEIISGREPVSEKLSLRCKEIKRKLIEFPNVVKQINSFSDLSGEPWKYETMIHSPNYRDKSSVRLTNSDRMIFGEVDSEEIFIVEELFHYFEDLNTKEIQSFKGIDLELYKLLLKYSLTLSSEIINELADLSENNPDKIWLFSEN